MNDYTTSKEQIEEMARTIDELLVEKPKDITRDAMNTATYLFDGGYRKLSDLSPCDCCMFNPPSSFGGKPCTLCVAQAKGEDE